MRFDIGVNKIITISKTASNTFIYVRNITKMVKNNN